MKAALIEPVRRFFSKMSQASLRARLDLLFLISSGLIVLTSVGVLQNGNIMGDDALARVSIIGNLASNFPNLGWDPHAFNGYSQAIGLPWSVFAPSALPVALGYDPIFIFRVSFVAYFILLGFAVFYFARKVGAPRVPALALSVLTWSTWGYWNWSVLGGAYNRVFSLPLMFAVLASTYEYTGLLGRGETSPRKYWLTLLLWFLTFLADVYVAIVAVAMASLFVALSAGRKDILVGLVRVAKLLLPTLALTSWYVTPIIRHALTIGPPRNDLTPTESSQLFWVGPILTTLVVLVIRKKTSNRPMTAEQKALVISLNVTSIYFLIMGWITPLWPFIPRLMAAYDSVAVLSLIFPMILASLFGLTSQTGATSLTRPLAATLILLIALNALVAIPSLRPSDWNPLTTELNRAVANGAIFSSDYRISLQSRVLTRWFPYYYPNAQQTGGRLYVLDPNPFYQSWYQTEVFYKDDLATLNSVYLEDQPTKNVSQFIGGPDNFAETKYWMDWYGVGTVVLASPFYPLDNTIAGYSERAAVFTTSEASTSYGPLTIVKCNDPGPVLVATNAPAIGFYSRQQGSLNQYNAILALLSYLGLGSKYVVPIYLSSLNNLDPASFNLIVTDYLTYSEETNRFNALRDQGLTSLVIPSYSLSQPNEQGVQWAYDLIRLMPSIIHLQSVSSNILATYPSKVINLSPQNWTIGYTQNANGSLTKGQDNVTLSVSIRDTARDAQVNIDYTLPNPIPLASQLQVLLWVKSNTDAVIGQVFSSQNFTSNFVGDDQKISQGIWVDLQTPFSNFTKWQDPSSKFATAGNFSIAVNIPPGHSTAMVQVRDVLLTVPSVTVLQLPGPVPLSLDGFLQGMPTGANSNVILTDEVGNMAGAYELKNNQQGSPIVPLAQFTSEANHPFTRILVAGNPTAQQVLVSLFQQPTWTPVQNTWTTNQNLEIPTVQTGFRGLVWKETYTSNWEIRARDGTGRDQSLQYYFAGPGLVYIPMNGSVFTDLSITYAAFTPTDLVLFALTAATPVLLVVFRRRIYVIGARKSNARTLEVAPARTDSNP